MAVATPEGRVPARDVASSPPSPAPAPPPATRPMVARDLAVLQVLDKISARTTTLRVPVGGSAAFGLIVITVRSCQKELPGETPEAAAFLEISEIDINSLPRNGGAINPQVTPVQKLLFSGWMFASSPALSALEHPVYDVTVIACEASAPPPAPAAPATPDSPTASPVDDAAPPAPED